MKRRTLFLASAIATLIFTSCQKSETSASGSNQSEIEKSALSLEAYVVNKHFTPVDFYSDVAIDYDETDNVVASETDLKKYILPYLADDQILFNANKTLTVNQSEMTMPGQDSAVLSRVWNISFSKSKNEMYLAYLDYFYEPAKYTVVSFDDTSILAYVNWTSKVDPSKTARLYTRFQKQ